MARYLESEFDPFDDLTETAAPWFTAGFDGDPASCCGSVVLEGETIRADGEGGWEHESCIEDQEWSEWDIR